MFKNILLCFEQTLDGLIEQYAEFMAHLSFVYHSGSLIISFTSVQAVNMILLKALQDNE